MKRSLKRTLAASMAVLSGLLIQTAGPLAVSAHAAPPVVDLQTCGSSYGEFGAQWWQWLLSIPSTTGPILDTSGIHCGRGQVDDVWFLAAADALESRAAHGPIRSHHQHRVQHGHDLHLTVQ